MKHPLVALAECCDFLDHIRRPVKESERVNGPYPYFGANGQQGWINDYLFDEPLVLLAEDGGHFSNPERGIAYKISGKTWVNNHAHVLRPRAGIIDINYLSHALKNKDVRRHLSGSTRDKLTKAGACQIEIPLPPLEEQRRIAAILDKAENINSLLKARQAAAELLIQSAFIDLFGNPKEEPSNSLFSISTLGERCVLFSGGTLPDGEENTGQEGGFLLLKVSDMNLPGNEERIRTSKLWASSPGAKSATCPAGSVVIPKRGGAIGTNKKRVVDRDAVLDPNLMAIAPADNTITTEFLRGWFSFLDLSSITSGSSVPQLNKQDLSPLRLVAPPMQIQEKYNKLSNSVSLVSEELRRQGGRFQSLLAVLRCNYFGGPSH
jgi:Restriction endonuclease S subunits